MTKSIPSDEQVVSLYRQGEAGMAPVWAPENFGLAFRTRALTRQLAKALVCALFVDEALRSPAGRSA